MAPVTRQAEQEQALRSEESLQLSTLIARLEALEASNEALKADNEALRSKAISHHWKPLPDPEVLCDGKDPKYEHWERKMKAKLLRDGPVVLPSAQEELDYVFLRCAGQAADYLNTRLQANDKNKISTAEEALAFLRSVFTDRRQREKARVALQSLRYTANTDFAAFRAKITQLLLEAEVDESEWSERLWIALPPLLKRQVRSMYDSSPPFSELCQEVDSAVALEQQIYAQRQVSGPKATGREAAAGSTKPAASKTTTPKAEGGNRPERRCFHCDKAGHLIAYCPEKAAERQAIAAGVAKGGKKARTIPMDEESASESEN
jgi:hypothetical protein